MTADQLDPGPTENKHEMPGPGKEFNGEQDWDFDSVAPPRHKNADGDSTSGWTLEKYGD